jgi:hypothetical protein
VDGTTNPVMNPSPAPQNRLQPGFRIQLRKAHLDSLAEMHKTTGGDLTLDEFCSQIIEAAVAAFRLEHISDEQTASGWKRCTPLGPPLKKRIASKPGALPNKKLAKLSEEMVDRIYELHDVKDLKAPAIAERLSICAVTVRRYLADRTK